MKKYILSAFLALGIFLSPAFVSPVEAAALTNTQINAIIGLLQAFGADQSVITNVQIALSGGTPTGGTTPTASFLINGQTSATNIDPLLPRTWAWSSTNGSSYSMSAVISGCETASQNGTVTAWTPWVDGSGTGASGSNTQTPGVVKYGCTIVGTYTAKNVANQSTSVSATITFKHSTATAGSSTLSVTLAGTGSGVVSSTQTGIGCGGGGTLCSSSYTNGTSVTLAATTASGSGSTFAGWSGACTGTSTYCTVTMSENKSVTATFNSTSGGNTYVLSVSKSGTGSGDVSCMVAGTATSCASNFASGTTVTLTTSASGSTFAGWSGACTNATGQCVVIMNANKSVIATFNNTSGGNTCTNWSTGSWTPSACPVSGIQTRSVTGIPSGCTGGMPPSSTQSCTPPQAPSCTGTHPAAGNGVVLNDYSITTTGPSGPSNTVWGYVDDVGFSCSWGCTFPTTRNGNVGCTPAKAGDGITVTVNDLSTGQRIPGVTITAGTVFGLGSNFAAVGLAGGSGAFTTNSNGVTPEFLFQTGPSGSWTSLAVQVPSGYKTSKIRNASGCTERVYVNGGKQWNYCVNAVNKTPVTINLVPGDIATTPILSFPKSSYTTSESLSGTVAGGDPSHTWGCIQRNGNTDPAAMCTSGYSTPWRQLGSSVDSAAGAAGWNLVSDNQGDRISLQALPLASFPPDTYTMYVRTGTSALDSGGASSHASATLTGAAPASAANVITKSLVINLLGAGSGSIVSSSPNFVTHHNMGTPNESTQYTTTITNDSQVTLFGAPAGATIAWTGCDSTSGGDGRNCIVTMSSNRTVNATFTKI